MKHFNKLVILFMTLAFIAAAITGCKGAVTPEDTTPKFTVTFDTDGGSAVSKQTVKEGEKASEPAAPTKAGYKFEGWFIGDTAYDFSSEVTANITLKAKWYKAYTITFEPNGGSNVDPIKVKEGTSAQAPKIPTRTGYSFLAWYLDGKAYDFSTTVNSDITLTAAWTIANYVVTFDADNGQTNETQIVKGFETASKPTTSPAKDGYTFIQWNYNGSPFDFNTPITSDITLTAEWIDNATIIGMTLDVTPNNIVNTILTLTASRTLKATGNFDSTTISNINAALKTLYQTSPSILIRLDLSDTTGLYSVSNSNYGFRPDTYEDDKKELFVECKNLETIILPETVTDIGSYAFYYCTNLAKIVIPNSVASIGVYAFSGCTGLTSITIPDSVTSIGDSAFCNCTGLETVYYTGTLEQWVAINMSSSPLEYGHAELYINNTKPEGSITIPNSVTSIGDYALSGCTGLTSITIPNSVTSIGDNALSGCTGLTSITIPNSVTSIGWSAFSGCTELKTVYYTGTLEQWLSINMYSSPCKNGADLYINNTKPEGSITIPNSVTRISSYALSGCTGLTSITIPNSVTRIDVGAFYGCTELTSITIPASVTYIDNFTFKDCTGLTSITIPDSVTYIGLDAFYGCTGLTSITIPASVKSIDACAFEGCTGLTSVTFKNTNGWKDSSGNPVSVADPEAAATLLKEGGKLTRSYNY